MVYEFNLIYIIQSGKFVLMSLNIRPFCGLAYRIKLIFKLWGKLCFREFVYKKGNTEMIKYITL